MKKFALSLFFCLGIVFYSQEAYCQGGLVRSGVRAIKNIPKVPPIPRFPSIPPVPPIPPVPMLHSSEIHTRIISNDLYKDLIMIKIASNLPDSTENNQNLYAVPKLELELTFPKQSPQPTVK